MCTNGVNTGQFALMLDQMDDQIAVNRRWIHKLAHVAGDGGFARTDETLHKIQELLDEARALLSEAKDALEDDASEAFEVKAV